MASITLSHLEMDKGLVLGTAKKLPEGKDTTNIGSSFRWRERLFILNNDKIEWGEYTKKGDIPIENLKYTIDSTNNIIRLYSGEVLKLVVKFDNRENVNATEKTEKPPPPPSEKKNIAAENLNYFRILLEKKNITMKIIGGKRSKKHKKKHHKKQRTKRRRTKKYLR